MYVIAGSVHDYACNTLLTPVAKYIGKCILSLFCSMEVIYKLGHVLSFVFENQCFIANNSNHLSLGTHRKAALKSKAKGIPFPHLLCNAPWAGRCSTKIALVWAIAYVNTFWAFIKMISENVKQYMSKWGIQGQWVLEMQEDCFRCSHSSLLTPHSSPFNFCGFATTCVSLLTYLSLTCCCAKDSHKPKGKLI